MRLREVDVRFVDGVDRRRVVALGDALVGVLADAGTAELVSLSVSGVDLATFAFAAVEPPAPVPLLTPTVGPTGGPSNTTWAPGASTGAGPTGAGPTDTAPLAEDCREAVLAAADGLGAGRVEVVADRVTSLPPLPDPDPLPEADADASADPDPAGPA